MLYENSKEQKLNWYVYVEGIIYQNTQMYPFKKKKKEKLIEKTFSELNIN